MKNKSETAKFLTDMIEKIDELPFVNQRYAFYLLLAMHIAGAIGLSMENSQELFQLLTPLNLSASAAIVLHFEAKKTKLYFYFILICFILGYGIEVIGVKTGVIFGEYAYGATLGLKLFDVPLLIGINWIMLSYVTRVTAQYFTKTPIFIALLASIMMVSLDLLIEPVAIQNDFWEWTNGYIPLQNYMAWFIISFVIQLIGLKLVPILNNQLAIKLLILEAMFFACLNFI